MKLSALQVSLCVSLAVHAVAVGTFMMLDYLPVKPALPPQNSVITLTLMAAPDEPVAQPISPMVKPVVVAPVEPPAPKPVVPVERKPADIPVPAEPTKPSVVAEPKPVSAPTPQAHGDNSSPEPGLDATTQKAQVGVKAEPNYRVNPEPPYPLAARRRHEQGLVLLTVKVTAQGRAAAVTLRQSSGHPLLDEAALQAVREWEFDPARVGSLAVESEIEVPVRFKLAE